MRDTYYSCPCGWRGRFNEGHVHTSRCPRCDALLDGDPWRAWGERLLDCPDWPYGATTSSKLTPIRTTSGVLWMRSYWPRGPWVPDLRDSGTRGVLYDLVFKPPLVGEALYFLRALETTCPS